MSRLVTKRVMALLIGLCACSAADHSRISIDNDRGLYLHVTPLVISAARGTLDGAEALELFLFADDAAALAERVIGWRVWSVDVDRVHLRIGRYPRRVDMPTEQHRSESFSCRLR